MEKNILTALFDAFEPMLTSEKEREILQESNHILEPLSRRLTAQEWDTLWAAARGSGRASGEDCFIRGFRLGVQLTLAGLEPMDRKRI